MDIILPDVSIRPVFETPQTHSGFQPYSGLKQADAIGHSSGLLYDIYSCTNGLNVSAAGGFPR